MTSSSSILWRYPRLIAHRGGGDSAPENTLAGFFSGHRAGFRMMECDVRLSRDGVPILLHDDTLERTTHGKGWARDYTALELQHIALRWTGTDKAKPRDPHLWRIPLLDEVLSFCYQRDLMLNIEIKPNPLQDEETVVVIAECLARHQHLPPILISSFSREVMIRACTLLSGYPRSVLAGTVDEESLHLAHSISAVAIHADGDFYAHQTLILCRAQGIPLALYTINDAQVISGLLVEGVAGVFTDNMKAPSLTH